MAGRRRRRAATTALAGLLVFAPSSAGRIGDSLGSEISVEDPLNSIGSTRCPREACTPAAVLARQSPRERLPGDLTVRAARRLPPCAHSSTLPDCQHHGRALCASGGLKVIVPDSMEPHLIAHYSFDDSRALDSSGHGNHASVVPMSGPGHGPEGNGAWFDGVKAMEVPHIPAMASPDLTVSFWLYLLEDSTNSYRTLVRKAKVVQDMTPAIMLLPNDRRLHLRLSTTATAGSGNSIVGFDSTAVIPLRRWTHVAYVLKGGAALSLYVNGVKDCPVLGTSRHTSGCAPSGATYAWDEGDVKHNQGPIYVGADPYMSGANMFMDGLKIYNAALAEKCAAGRRRVLPAPHTDHLHRARP